MNTTTAVRTIIATTAYMAATNLMLNPLRLFFSKLKHSKPISAGYVINHTNSFSYYEFKTSNKTVN